MAEQQNRKQKRPWITCAAVVLAFLLACGYLACWWPTKNWGPDDVENHILKPEDHRLVWFEPYFAAPLVVVADEWDTNADAGKGQHFRVYYLWVFGYVAKLHERSVTWKELQETHRVR